MSNNISREFIQLAWNWKLYNLREILLNPKNRFDREYGTFHSFVFNLIDQFSLNIY